MKKTFTLGLFLLAAVAAAGTYTITTSTAQDNRLEKERLRTNKATCALVNLPANCTQAQARNAVDSNGVPIPGASGLDVYSSVQDFLDRRVVPAYVQSLRVKDTSDDVVQFCTAWNAGTNATRNATCAAWGLPNGCELCP
jgi:hypothetical protein